MTRSSLSACIVTFNEADRIEACVRSLSFCDEILVVDSHSQDDTRARAAALGARVIERDWPGYRSQKQFAVEDARHDWVLCLDADERLTPQLREEILAARAAGFPGVAGYSVPRLTDYFGRFLRHGNAYPDRLVRLFDRRRGGWVGEESPRDPPPPPAGVQKSRQKKQRGPLVDTLSAPRPHPRSGPEQLVYEQAPAPTPGLGEALIAVHAAAITFAELTWDLSWTTRDGTDRTPVIPSHEMSGTMTGLGAAVADLAVGDEVIGLIDFDRDGAAVEYVVMPAASLAAKPQSVSHVEAATLPLAALTAWQALVDHAALEPGEQVLVQGAQAASAYSPSSSRRSSAATSPPPAPAWTPAWCGTSARNALSAPRPDVPARPRARSTSSSTQSAVPCLTAPTACCARAAGW